MVHFHCESSLVKKERTVLLVVRILKSILLLTRPANQDLSHIWQLTHAAHGRRVSMSDYIKVIQRLQKPSEWLFNFAQPNLGGSFTKQC